MSGTDKTGLQVADNQDPKNSDPDSGRLIWNNLLKRFFQVDNKGIKTDLVNNTDITNITIEVASLRIP